MSFSPVTGNWLLFVIHACIVSVAIQYEMYASKKFFPQEAQKGS